MTEALFSPSWYRVSQLRPRLRGHTQIYRHVYRGEVWYVLQDHAKGRYYRFNPASYHVVGQMDGKHSVQELWERTTEQLGDDGLTQDDVIRLLSQLHSADVLLCDVPPDTAELLRRAVKVESLQWQQKLKNPLALRFRLLDPDRFLDRTVRYVRPLFTVYGALLWIAVVGSAIVLAALHWPELTRNVVDRVLSAQNLMVIALAYPIVKAVHELGHGYAVKAWGGEVHEMGMMLLVFMPVPFVDASAASEFRAKRRRVIVGAAGILVELFLASIALFAWLNLEPGKLRSLAYNVMLIGGVSSIFFNGNPLLRYDGYYILSDLIDIPNLAQRSSNFFKFVVRRYAFGMDNTPRPYTAPGEQPWFIVYAIAGALYRLFIYTVIVLFVAGKFFFIGILLAIWATYSRVVAPLIKGGRFLMTDRALRERRPRAILVTLCTLGLAAALLFLVPVPSRTRAEGVVWVPDEALVRAGADGFVNRVVAEPNATVERGELLVECRDPLLVANVAVLRARMEELKSRYDTALATDRVQAQIMEKELSDVRRELAREEERLTELEIRSPKSGQFVLPEARDLPDRYLRHGDLIAFVLDTDNPTIRVVVPQSRVDLVRRRTDRVDVRLSESIDEVVPAVVKREVPEAEARLPSTTLGAFGGGQIAIDPSEQGGTKTFERLFQFDLELGRPVERVFIGSRVYVRFDHGHEALAFQLYRSVRQLLLRRFNV